VADEQVGHLLLLLKLVENLKNLATDRDVERGGRLVENQHLRRDGDGPRDPGLR